MTTTPTLTFLVARERQGSTRSQYLTLNDEGDGIGWTTDRAAAFRFASRDSADLAARMWYGARVAPAGAAA